MNTQKVELINSCGLIIAVARVGEEGEHFGGSVDLLTLSPEAHALFNEFEEIVNGQMFSFLDEIQAKIAAHRIRVVFEDGSEAPIRDLQIYPATGDMSFKLAELPVHNGKPGREAGKAWT